MSTTKPRALTGIRPSGDLHFGNYLGAIRPALELQKSHECIYFIADLHALTTNKDGKALHKYSLDIAAAWIALGLDTEKHILFRQSDNPEVTELAWYLSCCTGVGFLEKAHAYKDALLSEREVNHGVFAYPVLMAADIVLYDTDVVPVGKDQKQHVEMARDMAGSFNAVYGDILKLPSPLIHENVMTIPGLDGRKMSKSYNNVIPLFVDEKTLKKTIMGIKTDSTPMEEPKSLSGTLLGEIFPLFASEEEVKSLEARLKKGGLGWGHAKEELFEILNRMISEPRIHYNELRKNEPHIEKILDNGAKRAFEIGRQVLNKARVAIGARKMSR